MAGWYLGVALGSLVLGVGSKPTASPSIEDFVGAKSGTHSQGTRSQGVQAQGAGAEKAAPHSSARQLKELKAELRSPYVDKRRRTVAKLAAIGGRQAFALVLDALRDKEAEAADEAQLQLPAFEGSLGTQRLQRELLGRDGLRSKDGMVRLRVAEALGRLEGPVDGAALLGRLQHRDEAVSVALLWSLERLAIRGRLGPEAPELVRNLDRLFRPGVADAVQARALTALVHLDPAAFVERRAALRKRSGPESACALVAAEALAAQALGSYDAARSAVREALIDTDPRQRAMGIRLLPDVKPLRDDLETLAKRLGEEPRPALRARAVATLQKLTGWKHRERMAPWIHSISTLPADWIAPVPQAVDPDAEWEDSNPQEGSAASLERLAPMSDRLGLLVDFSGSLWNEREDGTCRKDLLDPEMDRLLDQLDPATRFVLIPFTGVPHPFAKASVVASKRELARAKRFFQKANMRGQGNLYAAVQAALTDADLDRLIILTDGAPTGGVRWNVELMGDLFVEQTRFRPVIFDFVLLDAPPPLQRAWASVARRTGGRTLALKM